MSYIFHMPVGRNREAKPYNSNKEFAEQATNGYETTQSKDANFQMALIAYDVKHVTKDDERRRKHVWRKH